MLGAPGAQALNMRMRERMDAIDRFLRSSEMRDVVEYGYGHELLEGVHFQYLGVGGR